MSDMNFKEWLAVQESAEHIDEDAKDFVNKWLWKQPLKAAVAGIGRPAIQVAKGLGNTLLKAPAQLATGDLYSAAGTAAKGIGQTLLSPVAGLARAGQVYFDRNADKSRLSAGGTSLPRQLLGLSDAPPPETLPLAAPPKKKDYPVAYPPDDRTEVMGKSVSQPKPKLDFRTYNDQNLRGLFEKLLANNKVEAAQKLNQYAMKYRGWPSLFAEEP